MSDKILLLFDIETEALPDDRLVGVMPEFSAPSNWKDPDKIADNIKSQKKTWKEKAALSPLTGRVLSIATQLAGRPNSFEERSDDDERFVIGSFMRYHKASGMGSSFKLGGWNIKSFDMGFIIRRAWALGIEVPTSLTPKGTARFYWPSMYIDMREIWSCGEYQCSGSLDAVGSALGISRKRGHGSNFAKLWRDPETRERAVDYQRSEMAILDGMAKRFGLID